MSTYWVIINGVNGHLYYLIHNITNNPLSHDSVENIGLTSQFATQNCLSCYSKLNLGSKFHAEVATHLSYIKLRTLYTLNIIL